MPPTARPLMSCWKNCSMVARARVEGRVRYGGPAPMARPALLLQDELTVRVDLVDPVQLADAVALGVEGDLAGEAREVLQLVHEIVTELVGVGGLRLRDGLRHHPEPVGRQDAVDGVGRLAVLRLVRR